MKIQAMKYALVSPFVSIQLTKTRPFQHTCDLTLKWNTLKMAYVPIKVVTQICMP